MYIMNIQQISTYFKIVETTKRLIDELSIEIEKEHNPLNKSLRRNIHYLEYLKSMLDPDTITLSEKIVFILRFLTEKKYTVIRYTVIEKENDVIIEFER